MWRDGWMSPCYSKTNTVKGLTVMSLDHLHVFLFVSTSFINTGGSKWVLKADTSTSKYAFFLHRRLLQSSAIGDYLTEWGHGHHLHTEARSNELAQWQSSCLEMCVISESGCFVELCRGTAWTCGCFLWEAAGLGGMQTLNEVNPQLQFWYICIVKKFFSGSIRGIHL